MYLVEFHHRCHPAPGPQHSISLSSSLALVRLEVEYIGHTAHAALSPWEGQNALDAAVLAYNNIALLRQQIKPTHRVHGIFEGKDWAPNIIPDNSKMYWYVRAQTTAEAEDTVKRVTACFEAAALASGCKVKITRGSTGNELRQNKALGDELADVVRKRYGAINYAWGISSASTDFGNISYSGFVTFNRRYTLNLVPLDDTELPGLHPGFSIPTIPDGGNHTLAFTDAARTEVSHDACMVVSKALAAVGLRVLTDAAFLEQVKQTFEEDKKTRGM
ncbi:peptidase M20, dimerization domain-containing protein [Hygrophoropsis aurantiaca]|uniref:Peptidase M20, dimerization domain-containing protein n=1 Tax=Hygrophoropsis aurantiaca TaxID=72124 RepID=A0ACB8A5X3_9AGAM|nr:peptidase M20, dimerization domain-containing protein [Hygrophoropsis aurantiaca]